MFEKESDMSKRIQPHQKLLAGLNGNVEAFYSNRIDHKAFKAEQLKTWDAVRKAGRAVEEKVLRGIHQQLTTR